MKNIKQITNALYFVEPTKLTREYAIKVLIETFEDYDGRICDLHIDIFDYTRKFIFYAEAEAELYAYNVFDAIADIQEYEEEHYGKICTDLSNSCDIANMIFYIIFYKLIGELNSIQNNWDKKITDEIRQEVLTELYDLQELVA
ncbi:MAG: hypothetical protein Q4B80_01715 [Aerococcaceae bacterium]|nr:hypothetical protein [Aerococcaceae bacterium]